MGEIKASFVNVAKRSPGVLYEPVQKNEKQRIAVLVMHSDEDYLLWPT